MKKYIRILFAVIFTLVSLGVQAQRDHVEMADTMRSEGKIYVVVAIVLIVLAGLIGYLFAVDRKISRLEKQIDRD